MLPWGVYLIKRRGQTLATLDDGALRVGHLEACLDAEGVWREECVEGCPVGTVNGLEGDERRVLDWLGAGADPERLAGSRAYLAAGPRLPALRAVDGIWRGAEAHCAALDAGLVSGPEVLLYSPGGTEAAAAVSESWSCPEGWSIEAE